MKWTNRHGRCLGIPHLPPVNSSTASGLYSAYRVTAQDPAPGGVVTDGHTTRSGGYDPVAVSLTVTPSR
ncbi:MAG TPA: hypothetical protein VGH79_12755 [Gaiellaceae bacterium]|jgi:hypothetical protein